MMKGRNKNARRKKKRHHPKKHTKKSTLIMILTPALKRKNKKEFPLLHMSVVQSECLCPAPQIHILKLNPQ